MPTSRPAALQFLLIAFAALTWASNSHGGQAAEKPEQARANGAAPVAKTVTLRGRCLSYGDNTPLAGVRVALFKVVGRTAPVVEAASAVTDDKGRYEIPDLDPPRPHSPVNRLLCVVFAEATDRPIGVAGLWTLHERNPFQIDVRILRDATRMSGRVLNARGQPVAGATVADWTVDGRRVPGILSATTDADGRFEINRIPDFQKALGRSLGATFAVVHPDYPETKLEVTNLPGNVTVTLPDGCSVMGTITDDVTGKPAAGVEVLATDANGTDETAAAPGAAAPPVPAQGSAVAVLVGDALAGTDERRCVSEGQSESRR
jgi:5-hydroxyisourate hydrolase-like protein (transthyretin family)